MHEFNEKVYPTFVLRGSLRECGVGIVKKKVHSSLMTSYAVKRLTAAFGCKINLPFFLSKAGKQ